MHNYIVMRKSLLFIMSLMLVSLTGCDFLRTVAGRPTSRDIEEKRIMIIKAEEAALQNHLDSVRLAQEKAVADSVAAMDSLKAYGVMINGPAWIGGLSGMELESGYYVIVGAFRERERAENLFSTASEKGYSPVLLDCRSGMTAVGLCPSDDIVAVADSYRRLRNEPFFPEGAWILVKE